MLRAAGLHAFNTLIPNTSPRATKIYNPVYSFAYKIVCKKLFSPEIYKLNTAAIIIPYLVFSEFWDPR